jgi:phosphopantothenoylcysteine decarboxylase/phosphopantothenate--cysteine ligase
LRVVLGVGGGIAAYKACEVASRLTQAGHEVHVVMTEAARQFVAPLTFEALTHRPVSTQVGDQPVGPLSHVSLAHMADVLVVAPLTADLLARFAHGRADDMLTAVYLGARCPVVLAPAMEPEMWDHPATRRAAALVREDGALLVGPGEGRMASGQMGVGRMVEPAAIVRAVQRAVTRKDLAGRAALVAAGPTWEFFDPVRVLSNPSTGSMGVALADAAYMRGAAVTLVHGPMLARPPVGVEAVGVHTTAEMARAVRERFGDTDVVVAAAAVADFRPKNPAAQKLKKQAAEDPEAWRVERTEDILAGLGKSKRARQLLVGFAAETEDHIAHALKKWEAKRLDLVVANRVDDGRGFGGGDTEAWLIEGPDRVAAYHGSKPGLADAIWDRVVDLWGRVAQGGSV